MPFLPQPSLFISGLADLLIKYWLAYTGGKHKKLQNSIFEIDGEPCCTFASFSWISLSVFFVLF